MQCTSQFPEKPILRKLDILDYISTTSPTLASASYYILRDTIAFGTIAGLFVKASQEFLDLAYQNGFLNDTGLNVVKWAFRDLETYNDFPYNMGALFGLVKGCHTLFIQLYPIYQAKLIRQKIAYVNTMKSISPTKLNEISEYSGIDLFKVLCPRFNLAQERIVNPICDDCDERPLNLSLAQIQSLNDLYNEIMSDYPNMSQIHFKRKTSLKDSIIEYYLIQQITEENRQILAQFALVNGLEALKESCEQFEEIKTPR